MKGNTSRVVASVQLLPDREVLYGVEIGPRKLEVPKVKGSPRTAKAHLMENGESLATISPGASLKVQRISYRGATA